jgi:hypothetical protein
MRSLLLLLAACGPAGSTDRGDTAPPAVGQAPTDTAAPVPGDTPMGVCINELMPSNQAALEVADGETPDWLELHNPTAREISLDGWVLTDTPGGPVDGAPRLDHNIAAGGFLLLFADGEAGGAHLPFRLNADGGALGLYTPDGRGQVVTFGQVEGDYAVARLTDCCEGPDCFRFQFRGTPGYSNGLAVDAGD